MSIGEIYKQPNNKSLEEKGFQKKEFIGFLENNGYINLKRIRNDSDNIVCTGEKNGVMCFIKKFNKPLFGEEKANAIRAQSEIDCYKNLPSEVLIDFVEGDTEQCFISIKYKQLEDLEKSKENVEGMIDLSLNKLSQVDASFLPEMTWELYERTFKKIDDIEKAGIISNGEEIKNMFIDKKDLIKNAQKFFAHLDFNFLNVKEINNKIVPFDFENATRDNAMVDVAVLFTEIGDDKELSKSFQKKISSNELYDEELLKLMIIRRCIIMLHVCINNPEKPVARRNREILERICETGTCYN